VRPPVAPRRDGRQTGAALWDLLAENLAERRIPIVVGARVTRLPTDDKRRVVGAEVAVAAETVLARARRGVVLACGGYAYDGDIQTQYYGLPLPTVCLTGTARGDGVRLPAAWGPTSGT
jgi:3-oxosteroid 1-dehydrogenase